MPNVLVGCGGFKNSISASERSQIEKSINTWAIHTPSLLGFFYYGLLQKWIQIVSGIFNNCISLSTVVMQ